MKPNYKLVLILSFFALLFITSCQNEFLEETPQNQEETLVPDSVLTTVMRSTVANSGTVDNILDETSCFAVNLPVTIIVNGVTITIDSLEDLEVIEEIYDEFEDDEDDLDFLFPITIILNNYDEIVIETEDALEAFIDECTENEIEDTIECVDFVYPITLSIYNSSFQVIENITFNNDEEFYEFIEDFEDDSNDQVIIASLNFPVSLIYADGSTSEVNNNDELQAAINAAEDDCDDSDDNNCTQEDVAMYLQECYWEIEYFNGDDNFSELHLQFGGEGALQITGENNVLVQGNWSLSTSNNGSLELVLSELTEFSEDLGGSWIIVECEDDRLQLVREAGGTSTTIVLDQECEGDVDCSAQELVQTLKECKWWMGTSLLSPNYSGPLFFNDDNVLLVGYPDNNQLQGSWEIALTDNGIFMFLTVGGDYEVIGLDWKLVECEYDRMEFISGDHSLVLEQECVEYDCEDMQANYGDDCETASGVVGYLNEDCECVLENDYDCPDIQANFGDDCETANGAVGFINEDCECIVENEFDCPDMQANIGDTCVNSTTGNEGFINENCECEEESSNAFDCFENEIETECDEGNDFDGIEVFNLNSFYEDCLTDNFEISYHISEADAHSNVNPLQSEFTNTENEQTIFARVTIAGTETYQIFTVILVVENCNTSGCTEVELDAILMECNWVPVMVNGSDDYSGVNMVFGEGQNVTVEGFGMTATATWSTAGNPTSGVWLTISQFESDFQALNGQWLVVECSDEMLHLEMNDQVLILERECN